MEMKAMQVETMEVEAMAWAVRAQDGESPLSLALP